MKMLIYVAKNFCDCQYQENAVEIEVIILKARRQSGVETVINFPLLTKISITLKLSSFRTIQLKHLQNLIALALGSGFVRIVVENRHKNKKKNILHADH